MLKNFFLSERNMLLAVVINALLICAMYFPSLKHNSWLEWIDIGFILLFVVEAGVKIYEHGLKGYFENYWNRFDFTIVVLSLPTLLVPFADVPDTGFFIVLRLFRIVRIARLLRFVPNMQHILKGLGRALKASVFVLAALIFLVFILAILTCHFYGEMVPNYFGDPLISIYSIFQLFTLEGWYEIPNAIATKTDSSYLIGATRLYFGFIVLLGGVFGMSLANAVFVDEMTMDNNEDLENKIDELGQQIAELKEMIKKTKES
ncbi:MAG: ion transporter [Bacteroidota bacterium]